MAAAAGAPSIKQAFIDRRNILKSEYDRLQGIINELQNTHTVLGSKPDLTRADATDYNRRAQDTQTDVTANNLALETLLMDIKEAVEKHNQTIRGMAVVAATAVGSIATLLQPATNIQHQNPAIAAAAAAITAAHLSAQAELNKLQTPAQPITEQAGQAILAEIQGKKAVLKKQSKN